MNSEDIVGTYDGWRVGDLKMVESMQMKGDGEQFHDCYDISCEL